MAKADGSGSSKRPAGDPPGDLPPIDDGATVREAPGTGTPPVESGGGKPVVNGPPVAAVLVQHDRDDLFVSCNPEAGPVARFAATVLPGPTPYIGAVIDPSVEGNIRYNPDEIVMVPGSEYRLFSKEYRRALADRALRLRTRAEWEQQLAAPAAG
jgi:hypothetical protein